MAGNLKTNKQTNKMRDCDQGRLKLVLQLGPSGPTFKVGPDAGVIRDQKSVEDVARRVGRDSIQILS